MKNLFRKSMFVLSFLGLFTFGAPKQAKAEPPKEYPGTATICCPDGSCRYVFCDSEETYWATYAFNCPENLIALD